MELVSGILCLSPLVRTKAILFQNVAASFIYTVYYQKLHLFHEWWLVEEQVKAKCFMYCIFYIQYYIY